jgi:hypothetical protein
MEMKNVVVYQAYGQPYILKQNLFSIVSLLKMHTGLKSVHKILIYTDQPDYFKNYLGNNPILQYENMSPERLAKWRGAINFVHRVKVEMLRDAAKLFPNENLFYMDGDTYFLSDPESLFTEINDRQSIMHEAENVIETGKDPLSKKVARFLKKNVFEIKGKSVKIPTSTTMWNAGVLGFTPAFFPDLDLVLEFTDQSYSRYQKHVMEQLAFSYFLSQKTDIIAARDVIHHYWRQKDEYNALVADFLEKTKNLEVGLKKYSEISWPAPPAPKKTFWQKLAGKFVSPN